MERGEGECGGAILAGATLTPGRAPGRGATALALYKPFPPPTPIA